MPELITVVPQEVAKVPEITQLMLEMDSTTADSRLHQYNEDDVLISYQEKACAIFDGVSEGGDGQEAVRIAKQTVQQILEINGDKESNSSKSSTSNFLKKIISGANQKVISFGVENSTNLGTTCTCVVFARDEFGNHYAGIANIGDSRAYIFRDGILTRITQDQNQTWLNFGKDNPQTKSIQDSLDNAITSDQLSPQEQEAYNNRGQICNEIGRFKGNPDIYFQDIQPGDILLLSTDGVHDNLTTQELQSIITQNTSNSALDITKKIVDQSVIRSEEGSFRSKPDDMTALIVKISDSKDDINRVKSSEKTGDYLPHLGDSIKIERSSGTIEAGWLIHYINREHGYMMVEKRDKTGQRYSKKISFDLAKFLNTPVTPEYISQAQDFNQLNYVIDQLGKIKDRIKRGFSSGYLKNTIQSIRNGRDSLDTLPNVYGLRETVLKLLGQE